MASAKPWGGFRGQLRADATPKRPCVATSPLRNTKINGILFQDEWISLDVRFKPPPPGASRGGGSPPIARCSRGASGHAPCPAARPRCRARLPQARPHRFTPLCGRSPVPARPVGSPRPAAGGRRRPSHGDAGRGATGRAGRCDWRTGGGGVAGGGGGGRRRGGAPHSRRRCDPGGRRGPAAPLGAARPGPAASRRPCPPAGGG